MTRNEMFGTLLTINLLLSFLEEKKYKLRECAMAFLFIFCMFWTPGMPFCLSI